MKKEYITLPRVGGIKVRKKYYVSEVFEGHPAKADIPMMIWILKRFVKDGDIVLDPMAGIGTTIVEGMRLFPNSTFVGVELEKKFVKLAIGSVDRTKSLAAVNFTYTPLGEAVCIHGDARDLERVLKRKVDKIVYSPPYGEGIGHGGGKNRKLVEEKKIALDKKYPAEHKENIGNLPHGNIDKVITSPPYSQIRMDGGGKDRAGMRPYTNEPANTWQTQRDQRNIGNLKHGNVDKVISSPPYSKDVEPHTEMRPGSEKEKIRGYSETQENIGNLKQQTYLEAMLLVYYQCFKVLKPEGLMILITKDFIRSQKRIRLGKDTVKLCEMAGFKHIYTYHRKIDNPSFWRILYERKYPDADKIDCEDIIVLRKEK